MTAAPALWYYSSAKPESGYSHAVCGYAHKLAEALDLRALALAGVDAASLEELRERQGVPQIIIGASPPEHWQPLPYNLKARPYGDQHGQGASMHALTLAELIAGQRQNSEKQAALIIANPPWLYTEPEAALVKVKALVQQAGLHRCTIISSPRSNPLMLEKLRSMTTEEILFNWCGGARENYIALLANAALIMLVGTSRSMASEAMLTGAPIFYLPDQPQQWQGFYDDTVALLGPKAMQRFGTAAIMPPLDQRFAPVDVTLHYVHEAMGQFYQWKQSTL